MEYLDKFFGQVFEYLQSHPQYGILVAMLLVIIYIIGLVFDWKWTLLPGDSSDFIRLWIEMFGRTTVRIFKGIIAIILLLALGYLYLHYNKP